MKRNNILKSLILITAVLIGTVQAYCATEVRQRLLTNAEPAVAITKESSYENGTVNPATGVHEGLNASFKLKTNGSDVDYDYIVSATTTVFQGEIPAFYQVGSKVYLIFCNTTQVPVQSSVDQLKAGNIKNRDVVAYPVIMEVSSPFTISYVPADNSYKILVNGGTEGTISQAIGAEPLPTSYNVGHDSAGNYRAVVTFTAISK